MIFLIINIIPSACPTKAYRYAPQKNGILL